MLRNTHLVYGGAMLVAFCISMLVTRWVRFFALRYDIVDQPGQRKMHQDPMPLLGGVAIVVTVYLMLLLAFLLVALRKQYGLDWIEKEFVGFLGVDATTKIGGILAGSFLIFVLGIIDDLRALTPWIKLAGQIVAAGVLVFSGIRIEFFVLSNVWLSGAVTIFWIVLLTNSMNLLDNMDGLCGGVSVIAAFSFYLCMQPNDEEMVRYLLMIFAGSVAGFLYHNLSPARIFMGDAGAMFNGYILATVAVVGTFHVETTPSRVAVAAPLLALSVPLFDTFSVIYLRWQSGQSIMKGDKRHFSHRLVDLGMSPRRAVEFIFLVATVVGLGAALLPILDLNGTLVILGQTIGIFLLIVVLMNAGNKPGGQNS